jgi:hypothetical protein
LGIVDSPVAPFFELPSKCDFIKIPTMVKVNQLYQIKEGEANEKEIYHR